MRSRTTAAAASMVLLLSGVLAVPTLAAAEEAPSPLPTMGEFDPADYSAEAAELPADLVTALVTDVEITPEEFLAQGDAAVEAVAVVDALEETGVAVLGSRLEGTELVVNVPTVEEAVVVESTGATAELGEPTASWVADGLELEFAADIYGGQGYIYPQGSALYQCSVGFTGFLVSSGAKQFATAGHCTEPMTGPAKVFAQTAPGSGGTVGAEIGSKISGSPLWGSGYDIGRVAVGGSHVQKASALTWGGGAGAPLASSPLAVTGDAGAINGAVLCKSGSRTGWTCGYVVDVDYTATVSGKSVNSVVASVCVRPGDSGGAAIIGNKAVGITSWTANSSTCSVSGGPFGGFFPMVSGSKESVETAYSGAWEMAAAVSAPQVTSLSGSSTNHTAINGTVPNAGRKYTVDVYLDGSGTPFTTVTVNPSSRAFTVSLTSVPAGVHSFRLVARYGTWSTSSATTGYIARSVTVQRISGADRYGTSAAVAAEFGPSSTVYIASGANYPDALSAAAPAGIAGAPLLLTDPNALPSAIQSRLTAINPSKVIILGGNLSVSSAVQSKIASILPSATISRLQGADRYATSRAITRAAFPTGSTLAYIATGVNFPDALSAAAAAASRNAPVILLYGAAGTLDTETRKLLTDLGVTQVVIAGGTASVSSGIQSALQGMGISVQRRAGDDRFGTSVQLNTAFSSSSQAFLANGYGFPDALSGAALAGSLDAPLYVVPQNCVPRPVLDELVRLGVTRVRLLGGTVSLSAAVASLQRC